MCTYQVTDLAAYLSGTWELAREIVARDGTSLGTFTGTGRFVRADSELHYHEQGELCLENHRSTARRTLRYQPETTTRCTVWFEDGHFFHDLELDTGSWRVEHPCRADLYRGSFRATGPDHWIQHWLVSGPEKAYGMTTRLTRLADT